MKYIKLLCITVLILSCSNKNITVSTEEIENIMDSSKTFNEAIDKLLEFEINNPNDISKLFLAKLYSEKNDFVKSSIYLNKINYNNKFNDKHRLQYDLLLIEESYRNKDFNRVLELLMKLKNSEIETEQTKLSFLEAEVLYILKDKRALARYNDLWESKPQDFNEFHFINFLTLLIESDKTSELGLEVIKYIESNKGYTVGLGSIEADILEHQQEYIQALLAIYKELEYGYYYNRISIEQILTNLNRLKLNFTKELSSSDSEYFDILLSSLVSYTDKNYKESQKGFAKLLTKYPENYYLYYLYISSLIYDGNTEELDITLYLTLEQRLISHPGYYHSLVTLAQKDEKNYTFKNMQNFLEKIIILNPSHERSMEAREELISLLELNCEPVNFYLPEEILYLINESINGLNNEYIEPLEKMLILPPNYYSDRVIFTVDTLVKESDVFRKKLKNDISLLSETAQKRMVMAGLI